MSLYSQHLTKQGNLYNKAQEHVHESEAVFRSESWRLTIVRPMFVQVWTPAATLTTPIVVSGYRSDHNVHC